MVAGLVQGDLIWLHPQLNFLPVSGGPYYPGKEPGCNPTHTYHQGAQWDLLLSKRAQDQAIQSLLMPRVRTQTVSVV